jgi:hypothetical protein
LDIGFPLSIHSHAPQTGAIDWERLARIKYLVAVPYAAGLAGDLLAVGTEAAAYGLLDFLRWGPAQQGHGTREIMRHEEVIAFEGKRHEHLVLTVVPAKDNLNARVDPVVTAYGEQPDVAGGDSMLVLEQVAELL